MIVQHYPDAVITFSPPENVFEKIFDTGEAEVIAELYLQNKELTPDPTSIRTIGAKLQEITGEPTENIPFEQQYIIMPDREKLVLYGVDQNNVYQTLKTAFHDNQIATLRSYQQYLPISVSGKQQTYRRYCKNTGIWKFAKQRANHTRAPCLL